jgi:hypothetical protein
MGLVVTTPEPQRLDPDESPFTETVGGWESLFLSDLATWGSAGFGAASSVAEALMIANAIALAWGTDEVFYRGEHRYGHRLLSRAERKLGSEDLVSSGISPRELEELRRFQSETLGNEGVVAEIFGDSAPDTNDPAWLTVMQHYDSSFGTRLLDLTRSIFAGLHFATISWGGQILEDIDGVLYVFMREGAPWRTDSYELLSHPRGSGGLENAYEGWPHPEYHRLYLSHLTANPRELAQDGVFLVRGDISRPPRFGQGLKIRIPGSAKNRIARELWFSGYTPNRIVRGTRGREAHRNVAAFLQIP